MSDQQRPALAVVGWELLRLGAFAFGGLGATLALLQRGLVDRRGWLKQEDISEAVRRRALSVPADEDLAEAA